MKKNVQEKLRILIADSDLQIARVIANTLQAMGVKQIHVVRNGEEALSHISRYPIDILITEWLMSPMNGLELVNFIRRDRQSPNRGMAVIMLTGKGEKPDVEQARDAGITEFLIKPFTTRTLFDRIEQLVDNPRGFVLSPGYIGPDRRRKGMSPDGKEKRDHVPRSIQAQPGVLDREFSEPMLVMPDHVLKRVMELPAPLATVITANMVAGAQKAIDDMKDESLRWIKDDLERLEASIVAMDKEPRPQLQDELEHAALQIKSRAGTFGYVLASNISRLLYLFLTSTYNKWKHAHNLVVHKHIEALKVAITTNVENQQAIGVELLDELQKLIERQE